MARIAGVDIPRDKRVVVSLLSQPFRLVFAEGTR